MPKPRDATVPVQSPCTGVCTLDPAGQLCIGCLRSGEEIAEWPMAHEGRRREILAAIQGRRRRAAPAANHNGEGDAG